MNFRQERAGRTAAVRVLMLIPAVLVAPGTSAAQTYETPQTLRASEILPPNLLHGPDFRVEEEVLNDGLINTYIIDSTFGQFTAVTTAKLRQRVGEVIALRHMETVRQSDIFQKSIIESGKDTVATVEDAVTNPVETMSGAVSGIGKAFARVGENLLGSTRSDVEGSRFEALIGFAKTKREYAFDFGVDVYSDNEVLQQRLNELARASYAGGLAYSAALSVVPGAAGLALTATGATHLTNEIYRTTAPADLRRMNRQKLAIMGVREAAADHFIDNAKFSPREQTELVLALERMKETKNRELFILQAALTADHDMAFFRQRQALMYADYHRSIAPIVRLVSFGEFVGAHTSQGRIVFDLPVDHLVWTEWMADAVEHVDAFAKAMPGMTGKELRITGTVSPHARQQLIERGWTVSDRAEGMVAAK